MVPNHLWTGPGDDPGGPAVDAAFDAVADRVRRAVLSHLASEDSPVAVDALAETVAECRDTYSHGDARIALRHTHLPKLEDYGFITYDDAVELTDEADLPLAILAVED